MNISENQLKSIIRESVYRILNEYYEMNGSNDMLHRGDNVILRGKYPAIVSVDEEIPDEEGVTSWIKLTTPDAFDTPEEENYSDWYPKDEIEKQDF